MVHGFCVAGGTDMALCSDLLVIEDDGEDRLPAGARVGLAHDRAVGAPRRRAARQAAAVHGRLAVGRRGASSGALRSRRRRPSELRERTEILVERIARVPVNQLMLMKLLVNQTLYAQGLHATQVLGTVFDGITRHTAEGYAFQQAAAGEGFREAVRERDEPFGDFGRSTFKG